MPKKSILGNIVGAFFDLFRSDRMDHAFTYDALPDGSRVIYDEDGIVHYVHDGSIYERSSDGYQEKVWDWGSFDEDAEAYYLNRHGDIPPSMLVDEEDERWVW